ncbi:outer membrane receptor protein involved in Fe transport [Salinibacter ruber]|uniref:TonB-dependent receptor domain-containing protein n=1 Tax=Salinibacter ruber TaxID=146919 RepID=UPI002168A70E|nr:TonB-dependent receptor [Salinibacter ruber]MCS3633277.1 outer membrane receptor protein involved in Fe transport [Salinibacter ruber]MCS3712947.1 outer membrane receptor protein involved in Fe transport [Salinibacter ruber]
MHTTRSKSSFGPRPVGLLGTVLLALLLGGLSSSPVLAQDEPAGVLTGRVVDAASDAPLQDATVALWKNTGGDSTLVRGTVTGPEGRFTIEDVALGSYTLRISFVGYTTERRPNTQPAPSPDEADLGTIRLGRTTTQQQEVEVTADRPAARIETDRNVYNTSERALSAGGSARTVLEDLPSIRIDMDGSISFRGNESVSLQINGEPASLQGQSLVSYLESLSADAVDRVEVIPNPSAKYEPEGMSGIINIVLSRDLEAKWNGGLTLGGERDANDRYGGNGSANAGFQAGGWRVVGTYSHRRDGEEDTDTRIVERLNGGGPSTWVDQNGREEEQDRSHSFRTDADYSFAEGTSLGLETSLSLRRGDENGRSAYREYTGGAPTAENLTDRYVRRLDNSSSEESVDGRLDFNHDFAQDHSLSAQVRYDRDLESEDGMYNIYGFENGARLSTPRDQEIDVVNEDEQDGSLKVDYARPLGSFSLETGYKGTLRRLDSDQTYEDRTTVFTFDELIHAAYGTVSRGIGDFQLEAGLRAEAVTTTFDLSSEDEVTNSSYVSLYPSAFLTYKPSPRRQARLSYSKRVDRPGLWDINPIEDNENPTFQERGNPGLAPEYIHSFELSLTQRWGIGSVSVTPYLRHTVNEIEEVRFEEDINGRTVIVRQAQNLSTSTSYGTELVTTFNAGDRLEGTLSGNLYRSVTDGSNVTTDLSQDAILFSGRGSVRAKLRDGLQLELSQFYRPARDIPPQGRIDRFASTELALQQELLGGDGTLTLRVDDLLNDTNMTMWYRDQDLYQESNMQWGAREVSLSFQYSFGSGSNDDRGRRDRDYR